MLENELRGRMGAKQGGDGGRLVNAGRWRGKSHLRGRT